MTQDDTNATGKGVNVIRLAETGDIPRLMEIRAAVGENRLSNTIIGEADYGQYIDSGCCWVWAQSEAVAGFAALDGKVASIWALFVDPQFEGRGVGRALLETMIAAARRLELPRLKLSTEAGSRAQGFYKNAGWSVVGSDDRGDILMQLIL